MQVDDRKDNGFVMVRRNLMGHVDRRDMSLSDFGVFCVLLLEADYRTSTWWGSAPALAAKFPDTSLKTIQGVLLRLKRKGYIQYETARGQRGNFSIFIPKFHPEEAEKQGPLPVLPQALPRHSSGTGKVTLTQYTGTGRVLEAKQNEEVTEESEDSVRHDCISDMNSQQTSILTNKVLIRPIQEEQYAQEVQENKKKLASSSVRPGTSSPSPAAANAGAPPPAPLQPAKPATIPNPAEALADRAAAKLRAKKGQPAPTTPMPAQKSEPWNILDFVFEMDKESTWNDIPVRELRRVVWHHFRGEESDGWWRANGKITSEARLAQAITEMAKQTPAFAKVPGWTTLSFPVADPDCPLCEGVGHQVVPNKAYIGDVSMIAAEQCSCCRVNPRPWRKVYREDD